MKFENPKMNISIFTVEDVITMSGEGDKATAVANQAILKDARVNDTTQILTFTFSSL